MNLNYAYLQAPSPVFPSIIYIGEGVVAVDWAQYLNPDYFSLAEAIAVDITMIDDNRRQLTVHTELTYISTFLIQ